MFAPLFRYSGVKFGVFFKLFKTVLDEVVTGLKNLFFFSKLLIFFLKKLASDVSFDGLLSNVFESKEMLSR